MTARTGPRYRVEERGERLRPGRLHPRREHLTRLRQVLDGLLGSAALEGARDVLDLGCGSQPYRPLLEARGLSYVGADLPGNPRSDLVLAGGAVPVPARSFDCVLSSQVLEHVESPEGYLREAWRVLRPGGHLILSTHGVWVYHADPADYRRWTGAGLRRELRSAGFEVLRMESIFGTAGVALQLWQDATLPRVPRPLRPLYAGGVQALIGFLERRNRGRFSENASAFVVLARKATGNGSP